MDPDDDRVVDRRRLRAIGLVRPRHRARRESGASLMRSSILIALACAGCASGGIPGARYANQPPVARVNDRLDVRTRPRTREVNIDLYHFDGSFYRLITRALELRRPQRALGVNAFDEVPDSTWFTNRIGVRDLALDE